MDDRQKVLGSLNGIGYAFVPWLMRFVQKMRFLCRANIQGAGRRAGPGTRRQMQDCDTDPGSTRHCAMEPASPRAAGSAHPAAPR